MWRNALIALGAASLLILGLGIIIYVGIARDRIMPTPMPTLTRRPVVIASATPLPPPPPSPSATVKPMASTGGIVREYSPDALIIVLTPREGTIEQVIVPENIEVTWSDGRRASPRDISPGLAIQAEGEVDALGRLIATRLVIESVVETPAPTRTALSGPSPTEPVSSPTSTPTRHSEAWQGEYFTNTILDGQAALVRSDPDIDFQWQGGSPADQIPADRFSARWRGRWTFRQGGYRFYAHADDGARVWVDGILVINAWHEQALTLSSGDRYISAGEHDVMVEYFEAEDLAQVRVWWDYRGPYPEWKGEYYGNPGLAGSATLVRNDTDVLFDWGAGSPSSQVPSDNFSARWTRTLVFAEGAYRFLARGDDGIRLWVDGIVLIDHWSESTPTTYEGYLWLDGGPHDLRIEYYEHAGDARIHVWWAPIKTFPEWKGEYYANPDLAGRPIFLRDDRVLDFNWGEGAPALGMPVDNFSIRWTRTISVAAGTYQFWALADDGVRLWVDDDLLIEDWRDSVAERVEQDAALEAGPHGLVVEYYERGAHAALQVGWELLGTPTPTATGTLAATATLTPVPPTSTSTALPPTATSTAIPATATLTAVPATPTDTPVPPTSTPPPSATATNTSVPPTETSEPETATPTDEPTPSAQTEQPTVEATLTETPAPE